MAERTVIVAGLKIERAGLQPVADADPGDRTPVASQSIDHAERAEHAIRRAGDRRGAAVESRGQDHVRIGDVDDDGGQFMRVERYGQRAADQSTAENDDVCFFHAATVTPRPARANAPQLREVRCLDAGLRKSD
jgi:hypothetical protein